jgi:hypothetical protein
MDINKLRSEFDEIQSVIMSVSKSSGAALELIKELLNG